MSTLLAFAGRGSLEGEELDVSHPSLRPVPFTALVAVLVPLVLVGCTGGQTGEIAADPCDSWPDLSASGADYSVEEPTPLGVSGAQALAAAGEAGSVEVTWIDGTRTTATFALAADLESSPTVTVVDRAAMCGDQVLRVLVLGSVATGDGLVDAVQRGALHRADDGRAHLSLGYFVDANPFPTELPGRSTGDGCADCGASYELIFFFDWAPGASAPLGTVELVEAGTLLGEAGTF